MKFRIRSKLAAALLLPLAALVALSGLLATQARAEADRVDEETEVALVALGPGSLTAALQNERTFASLDVLGLAGATPLEVTSFEQAVEETTAATRSLAALVAGGGPEVAAAYAPALEALDGIDAIRADYEVAAAQGGPDALADADAVFTAYTAVIDDLFTATSTLAAELDESVLRNGVELVDAVNRRFEAISVTTRAIALSALSLDEDGAPSTATLAAVAATTQEARLLQERIDGLTVGPYADLADDPSRTSFDGAIELFDAFLEGETLDLAELLRAVDVGDASVREQATDILRREASAIAGDARDEVQTYVIGAAAVLIAAILITYVASTSITRPLRALRREADDMAVNRLPEAVLSILDTPFGEDAVIPELPRIDIRTRDEVGDVVAALNEVQARTLSLAADQAVLRRNVADSFVNLGRRNQLLLDRQLDFITQLEQTETDPEALDALFKLDHLATRMRRNAESLLVLAGAESPRQWGVPVSITDVVRAGLGEVEDYQRVVIRHLDETDVEGGAAAGLAHVIAELAENALAFSPPDEPVEIKGRVAAEGYVLAIADNGIGMTGHDLAQANVRLAGGESYTVAPSRYLGHYVAGNLARQLGVQVQLRDDPAGGLVATITIPPSVLASGPVDAEPTWAEPLPVPATPAAAIPAAAIPAAATPAPAPDPVPAPEPAEAEVVATPEPAPEPPVAPTPEPAPVAPPAPAPVEPSWAAAEPAPEPVVAPTPEPVAQAEPEPVAAPEPAVESVFAPEPEPEPRAQPTVASIFGPETAPEPPSVRADATPEPDRTPEPPAPAPADPPTVPDGTGWTGLDALPPRRTPGRWEPPATLREALAEAPDDPGPLLGRTTDPAPADPAPPAADLGGLPRRVPGAQRPDVSPLRRTVDEAPAPSTPEAPTAAPAPTGEDPVVAAAGALGFLEAFAADPTPADHPEEDR